MPSLLISVTIPSLRSVLEQGAVIRNQTKSNYINQNRLVHSKSEIRSEVLVTPVIGSLYGIREHHDLRVKPRSMRVDHAETKVRLTFDFERHWSNFY